MFLKHGKTIVFKAANAVLGKIGGRASEEVITQIIRTKCMSVLLYGLEACPLRKSDINSLNFVVNRFFTVIEQRTINIVHVTIFIVNCCVWDDDLYIVLSLL